MKRALITLCLVALMYPQLLAADEQPPQRRITVTGEADVKVIPDKAILMCGVFTQHLNLQQAKQQNNDIIAKAFAVCESLKIKKEHIQTDYLHIDPRYQGGGWLDNFLGYEVNNTFSITITDTKILDDLITQLLQAGVNQIHDISFQSTDLKKYREQARKMALVAAKEKATKMAAVLNQTIGVPLEITEQPTYDNYWRNANRTAQVASSFGGYGGGASNDETVALGMITVRAGVQVSFSLEPESSNK